MFPMEKVNMKSYGDYPSESVEWWEEQEMPIYGKEYEDFEWDLVEEEYEDEDRDQEFS